MIVPEQTSEPRPAHDLRLRDWFTEAGLGVNDRALEPLVNALLVEVRDVFRDRPPQVALAEQDQLVETLGLFRGTSARRTRSS